MESNTSAVADATWGLQQPCLVTDFFSMACCNRTKGNGFKLEEGRFRLDIRKTFFRMSVVKHWRRLPREVVDAPSLETFQGRLDGAPSNLIYLNMSLLIAGVGRGGLDDL
ncbi:hypothetical protein QYF61_005297 [Mycteria americana]|uniref:Uncharacterized protein n=1 Tax=Mycteria americana TaxID=33587 RepID=A0AAN7RLM0_MYCAM|nr:hypothetical protein QYF61_005297 [Mycteria americana]